VIGLNEFRNIGREQRYVRRNLFVRAFVWLWGPIGIHSRIRAGHVLRTIRQLDLPLAARVLDAGSGHGLVLFSLASWCSESCLHGIEIDPELVAQSQAIARALHLTSVTFEQGDLASMDTVGGPYDLIFSIDVLEHIREDVDVLQKLRRAIQDQGVLVLHLPLRHQEQRRIFSPFKKHTVADHVRDEYLPSEIEAKLKASGFHVHDLNYGFGWCGELAFEFNNLFWRQPWLRAVIALLMYPLSWWLAFCDINDSPSRGNSLIIVAKPAV
jgi:2-polyprenyl-3-methyl-5-hydroxy-6-metoxy-1,4-benzoquinol methylase